MKYRILNFYDAWSFYIRMTGIIYYYATCRRFFAYCAYFIIPIIMKLKLWDVSILRAAEITFIVCIPVAFWMAEKINERWHDDRE